MMSDMGLKQLGILVPVCSPKLVQPVLECVAAISVLLVEDQTVGAHLAMIGSMNDDNIDSGELAIDLIKELEIDYADVIYKTYNITSEDVQNAVEEEHLMNDYSGMLCAVAKARNLLLSGARPDYMRAANLILDDFRAGRLGRITLEDTPSD